MVDAWTTGLALALYAAAVASSWPALAARGAHTVAARQPMHLPVALLAAAVGVHGLALVLRWQQHGHGPFTTLYEILSSNLWSLALVFVLASLAVREVRLALPVAAPVWVLLGSWLLMADARRGHIPPTYDTPLLYLHTVVGKAYLGLLLVAVATGLLPALRRRGPAVDERLDTLAHRFAGLAFVFEGLMLVVGAVWAQDAWGRYWAWDPLESWAFASWIALALALHARATLRPAPGRFGWWLAGCFALAFLTFFGVPYLSVAPHKGAI